MQTQRLSWKLSDFLAPDAGRLTQFPHGSEDYAIYLLLSKPPHKSYIYSQPESLHYQSSSSLLVKSCIRPSVSSHRNYATSKLRSDVKKRSFLVQNGEWARYLEILTVTAGPESPFTPFLNLSFVQGCKSLSGTRSFHASGEEENQVTSANCLFQPQ